MPTSGAAVNKEDGVSNLSVFAQTGAYGIDKDFAAVVHFQIHRDRITLEGRVQLSFVGAVAQVATAIPSAEFISVLFAFIMRAY